MRQVACPKCGCLTNESWKCAGNGIAACMWSRLICQKAFDRVLHSSVFQALRLQSASLQCIAVVAAMLSQCEIAVRLGHVITDPIKLHRGLPQGAPESLLLFIFVCELVLRPLLLRWQTEGKGWFFCEYWLASLRYADDILVFSENKDDVAKMLGELIDAFAKVDLDISVDKCVWSSYPPEKQGILTVGGFELKWVNSMTFVGTVINFSGNDGEAILHRLAQAAKSLGAWRQFLRSPRVALKKATQIAHLHGVRLSTMVVRDLAADKTAERASDELGRKDGLQYCRVQPSPCRHECCPILESPSPKTSQTPCRYGHHVRRPPSVETALLCGTSGKIDRSRPVAAAQDSLSVLVAERTSAIPFKI